MRWLAIKSNLRIFRQQKKWIWVESKIANSRKMMFFFSEQWFRDGSCWVRGRSLENKVRPSFSREIPKENHGRHEITSFSCVAVVAYVTSLAKMATRFCVYITHLSRIAHCGKPTWQKLLVSWFASVTGMIYLSDMENVILCTRENGDGGKTLNAKWMGNKIIEHVKKFRRGW